MEKQIRKSAASTSSLHFHEIHAHFSVVILRKCKVLLEAYGEGCPEIITGRTGDTAGYEREKKGAGGG